MPGTAFQRPVVYATSAVAELGFGFMPQMEFDEWKSDEQHPNSPTAKPIMPQLGAAEYLLQLYHSNASEIIDRQPPLLASTSFIFLLQWKLSIARVGH